MTLMKISKRKKARMMKMSMAKTMMITTIKVQRIIQVGIVLVAIRK